MSCPKPCFAQHHYTSLITFLEPKAFCSLRTTFSDRVEQQVGQMLGRQQRGQAWPCMGLEVNLGSSLSVVFTVHSTTLNHRSELGRRLLTLNFYHYIPNGLGFFGVEGKR